MTLSQLKHAQIFVKVANSEAFSGTVVDVDEHGIWLSSDELMKEIRGNYPLPKFLQDAAAPSIFLAFPQIEWMIGAEVS